MIELICCSIYLSIYLQLRVAAREERKKRREARKAEKDKEGGNKEKNSLGPARPKRIDKVIFDPVSGSILQSIHPYIHLSIRTSISSSSPLMDLL